MFEPWPVSGGDREDQDCDCDECGVSKRPKRRRCLILPSGDEDAGIQPQALASPPVPSAPTAPSLLRAAGARVKDSTLWSTAEFEVEGMVGTLEVETSLEPTDRADTLALKAVDRSLRLPRFPASVTPVALMERLHASLSAEYRIDGEYRLQQVTTYMDDELRVCRCATSRLGAAVSVYSRRGPPPQPAA